jgi:hypothetical protein
MQMRLPLCTMWQNLDEKTGAFRRSRPTVGVFLTRVLHSAHAFPFPPSAGLDLAVFGPPTGGLAATMALTCAALSTRPRQQLAGHDVDENERVRSPFTYICPAFQAYYNGDCPPVPGLRRGPVRSA